MTLVAEAVALWTHWSLTGGTAFIAEELRTVALWAETGALPGALAGELARLRAELLLTLWAVALVLSHHWLTLWSHHLSTLRGELRLSLRAAGHSALRAEVLHAWIEGRSLRSHRWTLWAEALALGTRAEIDWAAAVTFGTELRSQLDELLALRGESLRWAHLLASWRAHLRSHL